MSKPTGESKQFPLGAILSVVGDKLMCDIGQVYEILNFMTGDNLYTHQLPRAARECAPYLLGRYPQLREYDDSDVDRTNWEVKLASTIQKLGVSELAVWRIPSEDHPIIDPITELQSMIPPDKPIISINTDTGEVDEW